MGKGLDKGDKWDGREDNEGQSPGMGEGEYKADEACIEGAFLRRGTLLCICCLFPCG